MLWSPSPAAVERARLTGLIRRVTESAPGDPARGVADYPSLHRWSIDHPERFWAALWHFCEVVAAEREGGDPWDEVLVGGDRMAPPDPVHGPRWFTGSRLNFAENLLRYRDDGVALVSWNEEGRRQALTYAELYDEVARVAVWLRSVGVEPGDRVAGYLPNLPEAVIAMLASVSVGAIWSSCSPDFGVEGVVDRFGQIRPRVLFCADGYRYAGKELDSLGRVRRITAALPDLERVVVIPYRSPDPDLTGIPLGLLWGRLDGTARGDRAAPATVGANRPDDPHGVRFGIEFTRLPFDHPLYILYSSGTTGLPKCIVHGAGGTLIQHLKEHILHNDLGRDDRIFYYTTCGWMMWNWLVSALAVGATLVLYDGAPMHPRPDSLWELAAAERLTVFGTSARYLGLCRKEGLVPGQVHDLSSLRAILSTGSPLDPEGFDYVYERVKEDVRLSSISGGTDLIACFAIGNPIGPVWRGELQALALGMAVEIFDEHGRSVREEPGELVCTRPFPSMPVAFWNDPDGTRYRGAYFDRFEGVWRHGDWAEITARGGMIVYGRSDTTLNPGGVRIGTAEIYRAVERFPEVLESVVIEQELPGGSGGPGPRETRIVLFVRLRPGAALDESLRDRIRSRIRQNASPHHVPRVIVQVPDIPRTISGKISEVAVRDVIHGRVVKNVEALQNPESIEPFRELAVLRDFPAAG